jgi:hypothetical protein
MEVEIITPLIAESPIFDPYIGEKVMHQWRGRYMIA